MQITRTDTNRIINRFDKVEIRTIRAVQALRPVHPKMAKNLERTLRKLRQSLMNLLNVFDWYTNPSKKGATATEDDVLAAFAGLSYQLTLMDVLLSGIK